MKVWQIDVVFETSHLLGQDDAGKFWSQGDEFGRVGPRRYRWEAHVKAEDIAAAGLYVMAVVDQIVREGGLTKAPVFSRLTVAAVNESEEAGK